MSESLKHKPDDIAGLVGWLNAAEAFLLDAAGYERNEIPYRSAEACKNAAAALEQQAEDIAELEAKLTDENSESWKDLYRKQIAITDQLNGRIEELENAIRDEGLNLAVLEENLDAQKTLNERRLMDVRLKDKRIEELEANEDAGELLVNELIKAADKRIAELKAKLEAVRQVSRYPSGAFGEAPSGEYASEDGEFMFSEDVLAALVSRCPACMGFGGQHICLAVTGDDNGD
jgi:hypothetical protein